MSNTYNTNFAGAAQLAQQCVANLRRIFLEAI